MEPRQLLTTLVFPGSLPISTAGNDNIGLLIDSSGQYTVVFNGTFYQSTLGNVTDYQISGGDGNDSMIVSSAITIPGKLFGNGGNDTLQGGSGNDSLEGSAGTDVLFWDNGKDTLVGGSGVDTADYTSFGDPTGSINVTLDGSANDYVLANGVIVPAQTDFLSTENVAGTAGADRITGDSGVNQLLGLNGNDTITGAGGDDLIDGGSGADSLSGEAGNDVIMGGLGADTLIGGSGLDLMRGGNDNDFFNALDGAGGDTLFGEGGTDSASLDAGDLFTQ